jgi:hypothetical protein
MKSALLCTERSARMWKRIMAEGMKGNRGMEEEAPLRRQKIKPQNYSKIS